MTTSAMIFLFDLVEPFSKAAFAQHSYCDRYARNYASRYSRGGALQGAADGAIAGAIFGAIFDDDPGGGALFGAGMGALAGGAQKDSDERYLYRRAYDDCMRNQGRSRSGSRYRRY